VEKGVEIEPALMLLYFGRVKTINVMLRLLNGNILKKTMVFAVHLATVKGKIGLDANL